MHVISVDDLAPFAEIPEAKAQAMVDDALADASRVAPCINDDGLSDLKAAQFRSVLRGAILRWHEAGTGALQSQQAGPFGQTLDTRQVRKGMFWPNEIESLQDICKGDTTASGVFAIDTVPTSGNHAEGCSVWFGGACSCGAVLSGGLPLYGA